MTHGQTGHRTVGAADGWTKVRMNPSPDGSTDERINRWTNQETNGPTDGETDRPSCYAKNFAKVGRIRMMNDDPFIEPRWAGLPDASSADSSKESFFHCTSRSLSRSARVVEISVQSSKKNDFPLLSFARN